MDKRESDESNGKRRTQDTRGVPRRQVSVTRLARARTTGPAGISEPFPRRGDRASGSTARTRAAQRPLVARCGHSSRCRRGGVAAKGNPDAAAASSRADRTPGAVSPSAGYGREGRASSADPEDTKSIGSGRASAIAKGQSTANLPFTLIEDRNETGDVPAGTTVCHRDRRLDGYRLRAGSGCAHPGRGRHDLPADLPRVGRDPPGARGSGARADEWQRQAPPRTGSEQRRAWSRGPQRRGTDSSARGDSPRAAGRSARRLAWARHAAAPGDGQQD